MRRYGNSEKQKRTPKIKDKKQSERFREAARELGADESSDAFDRIVDEMTKPAAKINSNRIDAVRIARVEMFATLP
jgi:hypothetical protein